MKNNNFVARPELVWPLLIGLLALCVFGQGLTYNFLYYDDPINIYKNPYVKDLSVDNIKALWAKPHLDMYIPVTYTMWALIGAMSRLLFNGKLLPYFFHCSNLLFHILNAWLVYRILGLTAVAGPRPLEGDEKIQVQWAAGISALLFAVHPVQVEPVLWVTGFKDVFSAFWAFLAIYIFLRAFIDLSPSTEKPRWVTGGWFILAVVAYGLGLLAKPSVVVAPVFLLLIIWGIIGRLNLRAILLLVPWAVLSLGGVIWTRAFQKVPADSGLQIGLMEKIWLSGDTIMFYAYKVLFPFFPSPDYGRSVQEVVARPAGLFYWTIILMLIVVWSYYQKRKSLACLGMFVLGVLPVSGVVPFAFQQICNVADRYLYFPLIAVALAVFGVLCHYYNRFSLLIFTLIILILGVVSAWYVPFWQNTETLMRYTLVRTPDSLMAHNNLSAALMGAGKYEEAIGHLEKMLALGGNKFKAHYNLALTYALKEDFSRSYQHQRIVAKLVPEQGQKLKELLPMIRQAMQSGKLSPKLRQMMKNNE